MTQIADKREAIDGLLVHARSEHDVVTLAFALGFVEGEVGLVDYFVVAQTRLIPHHDADAGVLLDVHAVDDERFQQRVEQTNGDVIGLDRGVHAFGQVEELIATESADGVG